MKPKNNKDHFPSIHTYDCIPLKGAEKNQPTSTKK